MCTVIVVDKRMVTRNWMQECIENSNIKLGKIILCESGDEALEYISKNNIDIALLRLEKGDSASVDLVRAMRKKLLFSIVLGYGVCKDFNFLCNAVNSGISRYLKDVFDREKLELFLNEAYEGYCSSKIKLKYIVNTAYGKIEIAYSFKLLNEWIDSFSRNAIEDNEKEVDEYIELISKIMDHQEICHSKSMVLELLILINERVIKGEFKSDYSMLNSKDCFALMNFENVDELKRIFANCIKKLAKNIYLLTSASDYKSLSIITTTNYIKNNFQRDISRDEVAATVNLNPSYFSKFFKEQMGESFVAYLRRIRLEEAINRLEKTSDSIKAISISVGYVDSKYFSRLFYNHTGYSPYEYRENVVKLMA